MDVWSREATDVGMLILKDMKKGDFLFFFY